MKILVTGAGGMLGTDLVSRLSSKHQVIGTGRRPAPHLHIPFHLIHLEGREATKDLIEAEKPKIVLHAAAMTEVDLCETDRAAALRDNFEATRYVAEATNHVGALLIYFGTDFVFDGKQSTPYREEDIPHPISIYGETKFLAERFLCLQSKRFVIFRSSWLFGKHGDNFPKKILKQAEEGKPLHVVADQFGNPTFTWDLAGAVGEAIEILGQGAAGKENQVYHLTNEGTVSRYEFARAILRKRNLPLDRLSPISSKELRAAAARPQNSALLTEKIKKQFGIRFRSWEDALDAFLQEDLARLRQ